MSRQARDIFRVLIADDSADDRFLLRTAMRRANRLQIVAETADGDETIAWLRRTGARRGHDDAAFPDLLLLDLKMPVRDGFAVLKWLREQQLSRLTVVVLTESMEPDGIRRALELGADLFQVKPRLHNERVAMVLALEQYLVTAALVTSPRNGGESAISRPYLPCPAVSIP